jgi:hypothetical protein
MSSEWIERTFDADFYSLDAPVARGSQGPSHRTTEAAFKMGKTVAVFHFRYRSSGKWNTLKTSSSESNILSAALKSLHIMPRTPSPSPIRPIKDANEEMDGGEVEPNTPINRQNIKTKAEIIKRETTAGIKRDASEGGELDEVQFVSSKRLKKSPTPRNEVIVLD